MPPLPDKTDLSTPEGALASYQAAHARRDIDAALHAIDFRQEALDILSRGPGGTSLEQLAARREADYRAMLANGGFGKGTDIATCEVISKLEQTDSTAKFALRTTNMKNGTIFFSLQLRRTAEGWKIVRAS